MLVALRDPIGANQAEYGSSGAGWMPRMRWVVYDKVRFGIDLPEEAQLVHQERAYSSSIWYTPA